MNNELRLTDEQVEKAAEAYCRAALPTSNKIRAAAVHLQAPLAEPTEEEIRQFAQIDYYTTGRIPPHQLACGIALRQFVANREHPATPDSRRQKIAAILHEEVGRFVCPDSLTNKILSAVDEAGK